MKNCRIGIHEFGVKIIDLEQLPEKYTREAQAHSLPRFPYFERCKVLGQSRYISVSIMAMILTLYISDTRRGALHVHLSITTRSSSIVFFILPFLVLQR